MKSGLTVLLKNNSFLLLGLFFVGFLLRILFLPTGALTFSYDQGRDAFIARQIIHGDIKIQGPPSSTQGLFHGVLYYYFLAPFYLIGHGNPVFPAVGLAFVNSLGIFLIYIFSRRLFKNRLISILLAALYAFSFEQSQYAVWLSNPTYASFTVPLFYYSLWSWTQKKPWAPIIAGISLGLSVQAEIFLLYHLPVFGLLLLARQIVTSKNQILQFIIILFLAIFIRFFKRLT